jgi:GntR family transcriptional regulator / MocR family aminotransferase
LKRIDAIASLFLRLDRGSATFLQQQIGEGLRRAVSEGVLGPGTRLPSTRVLAAELAVSRTTIVAALHRLVEEGYLTPRERSGMFVASDLPAGRIAAVPARPTKASPLRLSRRTDELAHEAMTRRTVEPRPRAFRLSRPALDAFPVREWSRILSRRAARITVGQLDYGEESLELRAAIAELVSPSRGMNIHSDQVLLFSGGQRALEFAINAVLEPGDRVWLEDPGYHGARTVLRSAGARVVPVPVDEQGLVVAAGESLAADARLAYVTPSCQFPLGVTLSQTRRRQLLRWAERANACVIEDDYDCEFRFSGAPLAALQGLDTHGRVLYVSSFSRTMFPALRLGYLVAPRGLADRLRAARATMEEPMSSLAQLALADFITEGHFVRHLRRMKVLYRKRCEALVAAARGRLKIRPVAAGLHAVADLPPGVDAVAVAAAGARRGVEVTPLSQFHADGRSSPGALVLGFGAVDPERARAAMDRLAAAIDDVARRQAY